MALIKEGLWHIVNGTKAEPGEGAETRAKVLAQRDKALVTTVLAIEPGLLYLVGTDPTNCLEDTKGAILHRTWADKLELKQKLFSMWLADGGSVQEHIKFMIEICDELSVTGEPIRDENRVVYLLASLPESYNVLVTALEASTEVPTLIVVREHLLHED